MASPTERADEPVGKTQEPCNSAEGIIIHKKAAKRNLVSEHLKEPSPGEISGLVHELQAHQIELEMQNGELRGAQLDLEQLSKKYCDLFDFAPVGYFVLDSNDLVEESNFAAAKMLSLERSCLNKRPFSEFITPDSQDAFYFHRRKVIETQSQQTCELKLKNKDSGQIYVELSTILRQDSDDKPNGLLIAAIDVTDRKQAEESEQFLANIVREAFVAIAVGYPDGTLGISNRAFSELTGYSNEELQTLNWNNTLTPPEWREFEQSKLNELSITNKSVCYEKEYIRKDGSRVPVELSVHAVCDSEEHLSHYVGVVSDITERKQAADVLQESEVRFRELFQHMRSGVAVYKAVDGGRDFVFTDFNKAGEDIERTRREDVIGRKVTEVFPGVEEFGLLRVFRRVWKTGNPEHFPISLYEDERIAGWRENYVYKLPSGEIVAIYDDVTEIKKAQEELEQNRAELAHAWRVSAMGEMASGIAHELNQPLAAISNFAGGCARIMAGQEEEYGKVIDALQQISFQANRAGEIIRRLRNMVTKGQGEHSMVCINDVVEEVLSIQQSEAEHKSITICKELDHDLPSVFADPIQIGQVVLNIVRNAFESMTNKHPNERRVSIHTHLMMDNLIEAVICDTGIGLSDEIKNKLFEPFFTSKEKGLGVGLSLSKSIIEAHGGSLWAESNDDGGATFRFTLPVRPQDDQ